MTRALPIVHRVAEERWPTAEQAAASRWFSPVKIGPREARTRTWVPAMVPWRASAEGMVTQQVIDWYARFAKGKPGVLVVEATGVRDVPSGPLLRAGDDRYVDGLRALADAVREASDGETLLFLQLIDFLAIKRRPDPSRYFSQFLRVDSAHRARLDEIDGSISWIWATDEQVRARLAQLDDAALEQALDARELEALRYGYRERVTDTHLPHIAALPSALPPLFAAAAERAERAGFDGVELHYAHAYTMASFLSPTNTRADGYGGPREQRVRLPLEVYRAVSERVSPRFAVGCRFLGDEAIAHGGTVDDAAFYATQFAAAGMHFLSISKGGKFDDAAQPKVGHAAYPYTGPSGHECMPTVRSDARGPFGRNLGIAREVRAAVRSAGFETPVVAAGGINSFTLAERALEEGDADVIAAARQSLADPDWFAKVRAGDGASVRRCKFTNYCEALDQLHKEVTCQLWDRIRPGDAAEPPHRVSADTKRRLIAPP